MSVKSPSSERVQLGWRQGRDPAVLLACGLGSGFLPRAPGTWGSALAVVLWWWLLADLNVVVQLGVIGIVFVFGTLLVARVQRTQGVTDDGALVIDEFVGQWIVLLGLAAEPLLMLAAFGLFRLFDILKPWPIRAAERGIGGALGVMVDDVLAGLLGLAVLQITLFTISSL